MRNGIMLLMISVVDEDMLFVECASAILAVTIPVIRLAFLVAIKCVLADYTCL